MSFLAPLAPLLGGGAAAGGSALSGIGTVLGIGSTIMSTMAAVSQAKYQSAVAKNNAQIAANNAQKASDQSQEQQLQHDQEVAAMIGEQEAIQGASGLSISGGSQLRTRRSAMRLGRADALSIREQGRTNIEGFLQESENFKAESANAKKQIPGIILGGMFDIGSSLVGGASSVRGTSRFTGSATKRFNDRLVTKSARIK